MSRYPKLIEALDEAVAALVHSHGGHDAIMDRVVSEAGLIAALHLPLDLALKHAKLRQALAENAASAATDGVVVVSDPYAEDVEIGEPDDA